MPKLSEIQLLARDAKRDLNAELLESISQMKAGKLNDRDRNLIPNEVAGMVIESDMTPIRAWREYLGMTQAEVAERLEVSQSAFAQFESPDAKPRRATIKRVAKALSISVEQLDF